MPNRSMIAYELENIAILKVKDDADIDMFYGI